MNYYHHHLGDYAAATAHLSWDEDMAYTRLLRAYYTAEQGIPDATKYRLARAATRAQKQAVDVVLNEFFALQDGIWRQTRAEEEITAYQDKQAKAKRSADVRWKDKRTHSEGNANASPDAMRTHSGGNAPNPNNQQEQKPAVGNPIPDCETSNASAREATGGSNIPTALQAMAAQAHRDNPALAAVVRLRRRGAQWLRLTPENPEIQTAIGEGVTVESIEAMAEAYPDKPPLYVIRAARRDHASQPATIPQQEFHHGPRHAASAVAETLAAIHRRREREATTTPAIEHDAG